MALNITVHDPLMNRNGAAAQVPTLAIDGAGQAQTVALGAASAALQRGALLCLIADEDQRIKLRTQSGYSAPDAAGIKLLAGVERWYALPDRGGPFTLSCVAG